MRPANPKLRVAATGAAVIAPFPLPREAPEVPALLLGRSLSQPPCWRSNSAGLGCQSGSRLYYHDLAFVSRSIAKRLFRHTLISDDPVLAVKKVNLKSMQFPLPLQIGATLYHTNRISIRSPDLIPCRSRNHTLVTQ